MMIGSRPSVLINDGKRPSMMQSGLIIPPPGQIFKKQVEHQKVEGQGYVAQPAFQSEEEEQQQKPISVKDRLAMMNKAPVIILPKPQQAPPKQPSTNIADKIKSLQQNQEPIKAMDNNIDAARKDSDATKTKIEDTKQPINKDFLQNLSQKIGQGVMLPGMGKTTGEVSAYLQPSQQKKVEANNVGRVEGEVEYKGADMSKDDIKKKLAMVMMGGPKFKQQDVSEQKEPEQQKAELRAVVPNHSHQRMKLSNFE